MGEREKLYFSFLIIQKGELTNFDRSVRRIDCLDEKSNAAKSNVENRARQRTLLIQIHKATVPFVAPYFPQLSELGKSSHILVPLAILHCCEG